jgi:hypothetical protein
LAREKPEKAGLEFALARADLHARTVGTRAHREPAYSVVKKSIAAEFIRQLLCGGTPFLRRLARFQFGGVKEDALPHTSLGRLRDFLEHDLRPRALHFKRGVGSWPAQEGVNAGVKIARFCTAQKLGNAWAQASEGMGKSRRHPHGLRGFEYALERNSMYCTETSSIISTTWSSVK